MLLRGQSRMLKGLAIIMVVVAAISALVGQISSALMFTAVAAINIASLWLKAQRAPREERFWAETECDKPHRLYLTHRPVGANGSGRPGWRLEVAGAGA